MLAVAATARTAVPVHGRERVELHGLRLLEEAVLDVGSRDRCGPLRTEREGAAASVVERVHLLVDDVGRLARRPVKEAGVLKSRRLDAAVSVDRRQRVDRVYELPPAPL